MFEEAGCATDSFAAPLKDVCSAIFGWPRDLLEGDTVESREFRETPDLFWSKKLDIPNFTPRLALQLLGTDVLRKHWHEDLWMDSLEYRIRKSHKDQTVVISDARFQNELKLINRMGGKVIWVRRNELPEWWDTAKDANDSAVAHKIMKTKYKDVHESEWNWVGSPVDYVIHNDGSIEDLEEKVKNIQKSLLIPSLKLV